MLENREGKTIPNVTFKVIENGKWKDVNTDDLFAGKKVIVFSLPGAFTPTCSTSHLPRYNELWSTFKDHGVDGIYCVSVNDTFVMNEWQREQNAHNITMVPDGNGDFSQGMGMLVDKTGIGFGKRSWRYSMLVDNKTIKKMFIEPEVDGDPYEVSDADTMLKYVAPNSKGNESVVLFTKPGCPHCARAKGMLQSKGMVYDEIRLGEQVPMRTLRAISGASSTPQVFVGGERIGGADDLEKYLGKH